MFWRHHDQRGPYFDDLVVVIQLGNVLVTRPAPSLRHFLLSGETFPRLMSSLLKYMDQIRALNRGGYLKPYNRLRLQTAGETTDYYSLTECWRYFLRRSMTVPSENKFGKFDASLFSAVLHDHLPVSTSLTWVDICSPTVISSFVQSWNMFLTLLL